MAGARKLSLVSKNNVSKSRIKWEEAGGVSACIVDGDHVGNVFKWGGSYGAAFQGQEAKMFDHKFEAKDHLKKDAISHRARMAHLDQTNNSEFEVNEKDWARRDYASRQKQFAAKKAMKELPF